MFSELLSFALPLSSFSVLAMEDAAGSAAGPGIASLLTEAAPALCTLPPVLISIFTLKCSFEAKSCYGACPSNRVEVILCSPPPSILGRRDHGNYVTA